MEEADRRDQIRREKLAKAQNQKATEATEATGTDGASPVEDAPAPQVEEPVAVTEAGAGHSEDAADPVPESAAGGDNEARETRSHEEL